MKKYILTLSILFSTLTYAQVGINTNIPSVNLNIVTVGENDSTLTTNEGLLIPKISLSRAQQMTSEQNVATGTIVFINDIDNNNLTESTIYIKKNGFYYFDGDYWINLTNENTDSTLYNTNGTLKDNRKVNLGKSSLAFKSDATTGINRFSVDESTLSINTENDLVGIGTTNPRSKLHVDGDLQFTGTLKVGANGNTGNRGEILKIINGTTPTWYRQDSNGDSPYTFSNGLEKDNYYENQYNLGGKLTHDTKINLNSRTLLLTGWGYDSVLFIRRGRGSLNPQQKVLSVDLDKKSVGIGNNINTERDFHVDGSMLLNGSLHLFDSSIARGNPGIAGNPSNNIPYQYLTSQDINSAPTWSSVTPSESIPLTFSNGVQKKQIDTDTFQLGGSLNKNTFINTNGNTFSFKGNQSSGDAFIVKNNEISADTPTIYSDLNSSKKIGIATNSPTNTLDVNGSLKIGEISTSTNSSNKVLVVNDNGVVESMNNNFASYLISGSIYAYYTNNGGNANGAEPLLNYNKVIGGRDGVSYNLSPTQTAISRRYGLQFISGNGYTVSNPTDGVFDIMFDTEFEELTGVSVNLFDTYINKGNAQQNINGLGLFVTDNTQLSYISNKIIRIKTADNNGKLANRSFTFIAVGR